MYRADRVKVKKFFGDVETNYLDGFQYKFTYAWEDETFTIVNDELRLRIIPTSEGYFDALLNLYVYNYVDHLGNVRISYADSDHDGIIRGIDQRIKECHDGNCVDYFKPGEIVSNNTYYPFGMLFDHQYQASNENAYKYKYNGKELQETGFYSFKWRNYMPDVGRFFNIDSLAEKYTHNSTYAFSENRVIDARELEGLEAVLIKDTKANHSIVKTANNGQYANTKTVHVFAHGNPQEFYDEYGKPGETTINSGALLNSILNRSSDLWKNSESKEGFTVVLHSCRTGRTTVDKKGNLTESVAEKISDSKEMKGVTIIAPDERDFVNGNGIEIGPQSAKNTDNNGEYLPNTPRSEHGKPTGQFGSWNSFKNGQQTNQQPGTTKPQGTDQRSSWDRIFNNRATN